MNNSSNGNDRMSTRGPQPPTMLSGNVGSAPSNSVPATSVVPSSFRRQHGLQAPPPSSSSSYIRRGSNLSSKASSRIRSGSSNSTRVTSNVSNVGKKANTTPKIGLYHPSSVGRYQRQYSQPKQKQQQMSHLSASLPFSKSYSFTKSTSTTNSTNVANASHDPNTDLTTAADGKVEEKNTSSYPLYTTNAPIISSSVTGLNPTQSVSNAATNINSSTTRGGGSDGSDTSGSVLHSATSNFHKSNIVETSNNSISSINDTNKQFLRSAATGTTTRTKATLPRRNNRLKQNVKTRNNNDITSSYYNYLGSANSSCENQSNYLPKPKKSSICPLFCVFYAEFDIVVGPKVCFQAPERFMDRDISISMEEIHECLEEAFEKILPSNDRSSNTKSTQNNTIPDGSTADNADGESNGDADSAKELLDNIETDPAPAHERDDSVTDETKPGSESNYQYPESHYQQNTPKTTPKIQSSARKTGPINKIHPNSLSIFDATSEYIITDQISANHNTKKNNATTHNNNSNNSTNHNNTHLLNTNIHNTGNASSNSTDTSTPSSYTSSSQILNLSTHNLHIASRPTIISNTTYERNSLLFSVGFILRRHTVDPLPFFPLLCKLANTLQAMEIESQFLTSDSSRQNIQGILEAILVSLNSKRSECNVVLDKANALNLKRFRPPKPIAPPVPDHIVPILLRPEWQLQLFDWDLTINLIVSHINGVKHVRKIAQSSEVDMEMVRACLRVLVHHGVLGMVDIFRYDNVYECTDLACELLLSARNNGFGHSGSGTGGGQQGRLLDVALAFVGKQHQHGGNAGSTYGGSGKGGYDGGGGSGSGLSPGTSPLLLNPMDVSRHSRQLVVDEDMNLNMNTMNINSTSNTHNKFPQMSHRHTAEIGRNINGAAPVPLPISSSSASPRNAFSAHSFSPTSNTFVHANIGNSPSGIGAGNVIPPSLPEGTEQQQQQQNHHHSSGQFSSEQSHMQQNSLQRKEQRMLKMALAILYCSCQRNKTFGETLISKVMESLSTCSSSSSLSSSAKEWKRSSSTVSDAASPRRTSSSILQSEIKEYESDHHHSHSDGDEDGYEKEDTEGEVKVIPIKNGTSDNANETPSSKKYGTASASLRARSGSNTSSRGAGMTGHSSNSHHFSPHIKSHHSDSGDSSGGGLSGGAESSQAFRHNHSGGDSGEQRNNSNRTKKKKKKKKGKNKLVEDIDWGQAFEYFDHRRFITFGVIHGLIRRVHVYPLAYDLDFNGRGSGATDMVDKVGVKEGTEKTSVKVGHNKDKDQLHHEDKKDTIGNEASIQTKKTDDTSSIRFSPIFQSQVALSMTPPRFVLQRQASVGGSAAASISLGKEKSNNNNMSCLKTLALQVANSMDGTKCDDELSCRYQKPLSELIELVKVHGKKEVMTILSTSQAV